MSDGTLAEPLPDEVPAAVIFDCDGVLIDSVELKTAAFVELFADHPEHHEAIARHHEMNLGISRFEKFAWIHRELLDRPLDRAESLELGRRFSDLVFTAAVGCAAVPGAEAALEALAKALVPLFIASGTPQDELDRLIEARGWTRYFREIHGSPRSKPDILLGVAQSLDVPPARMVFIGDGRSDHLAASHAGVPFVLRETESQARFFTRYDGPRITDLRGLAQRLTAA